MLAALARLVEPFDIPCEVSLENHMACGFGACFREIPGNNLILIRDPDCP